MKNWIMLAATVVGFIAAPARADDKADAAAGVKAWAIAVADGDAAGVKAHSMGSEADMARFQQMAGMVLASKKLSAAARVKYGEEGAGPMGRMGQRPDLTKLDNSKVEVAGDEATVTGQDGKALKAKKEGGEWKVVLDSLGPTSKIDPKQIAAATDAMTTTADEIKDGKYPTIKEAMLAFAAKMKAITGGAAKAEPAKEGK